MTSKPIHTRVLTGARIMLTLLLASGFTGCGAQHLLEPGSIEAFHNVAAPYLFVGCREVTIAPVYTVDLKGGMPRHTGGVMVGGCGRLAELKCGKTSDNEALACETLKQWDEHVLAPPLPPREESIPPAEVP
jgi:hypothetical protein